MSIADLSNVLKIFSEPELDPEEKKILFKEVLLMTLARASNSDANIHPVEIATIQDIMERTTGDDLSEADIRLAARAELYQDTSLRKYLATVRRKLDERERVEIVQSLAEVIKSDTEVSVLEIDFFNRVADALRITPSELVGLVPTQG